MHIITLLMPIGHFARRYIGTRFLRKIKHLYNVILHKIILFFTKKKV